MVNICKYYASCNNGLGYCTNKNNKDYQVAGRGKDIRLKHKRCLKKYCPLEVVNPK